MDFPIPPLPLFISTFSRYAPGILQALNQSNSAGPTTITWPVADTAFYVPVFLPWPYPVKRVWWSNGTSVTSTNMDFGIYTEGGTRIYSVGSTAASGTNAPQYTTVDFVLGAGAYYFAVSDSSTTASRGGQGLTGLSVLALRMRGVLQEASARPLPATMNPSAVANSCLPFCGITRTTSGS